MLYSRSTPLRAAARGQCTTSKHTAKHHSTLCVCDRAYTVQVLYLYVLYLYTGSYEYVPVVPVAIMLLYSHMVRRTRTEVQGTGTAYMYCSARVLVLTPPVLQYIQYR